jgi:uncharacterized protein
VAYISVGVETQAATAGAASADNSRRMMAVLDALRGQGIPDADVQTTGVNIVPRYAQPPQVPQPALPGGAPGAPVPPPPPGGPRSGEIVGYAATNNVQIRVDGVERASAILEAAVAAGANRVGGLRMGFRDPSALRERALTDAGRAAWARARALADGLGLRVVGVRGAQQVEWGGYGAAAFPEIPAFRDGATPAPPPPIQGGETLITARVQVSFLFE